MHKKPTFSTYVNDASIDNTVSAIETSATSYKAELLYSGIFYDNVLEAAESKIDSIFDRHVTMTYEALNEYKQAKKLYSWALDPATAVKSVGYTTGATRVNDFGATYKALNDNDFLKALKYFQKQGLKPGIAILTPQMYNDLLNTDPLLKLSLGMNQELLKTGNYGQHRGWTIYVSNFLPAYTSANAKKAIGSVVTNTDKECAVFFSAGYVRKGESTVEMIIGNGIDKLRKQSYRVMQRVGSTVGHEINSDPIDRLYQQVLGVYTLIEG